MTAEADVHSLADAAEQVGSEFFEVFADYIAPILGLVVGWVVGPMIGGMATVGNFVYGIAIKTPQISVASAQRIADFAAGGVMGGIWAIFGGGMWSLSEKHKGKKVSNLLARGAIRFLAGLGFGAALGDAIGGFSGQFGEGWIDGLGTGLTAGVKQ